MLSSACRGCCHLFVKLIKKAADVLRRARDSNPETTLIFVPSILFLFPSLYSLSPLSIFVSLSLSTICRYYLFALILNLTRDAYEIGLLMERESRCCGSAKASLSSTPTALTPENGDLPATPSSASGSASPSPPPLLLPVAPSLPALSLRLRRQMRLLAAVLRNNPPLLLDLLKNTCDIFIPLDRLGIYPTGNGFVGACGLASSVLSILTILHPWLKLKP